MDMIVKKRLAGGGPLKIQHVSDITEAPPIEKEIDEEERRRFLMRVRAVCLLWAVTVSPCHRVTVLLV
jgi:hypothetical protein